MVMVGGLVGLVVVMEEWSGDAGIATWWAEMGRGTVGGGDLWARPATLRRGDERNA